MMPQTCSTIRSSLVGYLGEQIGVSAVDRTCVITLPLKTLDDRYLDVYVEPTVSTWVSVHDGGDAVAELYLQGIHLTGNGEDEMRAIAERYGVAFSAGSFSALVKPEETQRAVLAIAQCASIAMHRVLAHKAVLDDEPVSALVRRTLTKWQPESVDLKHHVRVKGMASPNHLFDSVAFPRDGRTQAVAIRTLGTAYRPEIQTARYGFAALDLEGTPYSKWRRVAVVAKVEKWPAGSLETVRRLSSLTIEVNTGDEDRISRLLPTYVSDLLAA